MGSVYKPPDKKSFKAYIIIVIILENALKSICFITQWHWSSCYPEAGRGEEHLHAARTLIKYAACSWRYQTDSQTKKGDRFHVVREFGY